jgi:hypothetical protein
MKEIIAIKNRDRIGILVDDEDYEELSKYRWCICNPNSNLLYAHRRSTKEERANRYPTIVKMHRQILRLLLEPTIRVDHKNCDGLDNRRENLRIATILQNNANTSKHSDGSSMYKGVSWDTINSKWKAQVRHKGKNYNLGRFTSEEDAAIAYNDKAKEFFGEFARLNSIKEGG